MRALLVAVVLAAAGCGTPTGSPPPAGSPAPDLAATDLAFVDLLIPQNESTLAALALTSANPGSALHPVARQVETRYRAELAQVRELLARIGRQESDQHDGHDMPGMITAAELATLAHDRGTAFDQQLKALLRSQFEEARTVARAELSSGTSQPVLELGARVDSTRAEFLALLEGVQR
ncbi:DUF305 domain-containing protein [Lentzea sp. BCCO 10_0856]|uniref:DUF305 domain-containing protein n=1 Tax=Lentzea miocenica TaxID=3095431 RepID=A0ABU4T7P7_9PSEU|nr:DUF305 domain-containing protein [Lentzea sp. BCCO 10_0856]MDX8034190.1 DUF305 domain-containing protein [Lentzea sp. BCCO 10_0856]